MTKRDEILECTRDAAKGAGFDPDDERILAMRRNIAAVWLADYQLDREELVADLQSIRNQLLGVRGCTTPREAQTLGAQITRLNNLIAKLS